MLSANNAKAVGVVIGVSVGVSIGVGVGVDVDVGVGKGVGVTLGPQATPSAIQQRGMIPEASLVTGIARNHTGRTGHITTPAGINLGNYGCVG